MDVVSPLRVLVVDDEDPVRRVVRTMLERAGFVAVDVAAAEQALECVARERFDLAILDHQMPGMDGPTLALQLRARVPALRLVLFTGGYVEGELTGHFDAVLSKPVRPAELTALVRSVCGR